MAENFTEKGKWKNEKIKNPGEPILKRKKVKSSSQKNRTKLIKEPNKRVNNKK